MKIGDQVLYVLNDPVDLDRDLGEVIDIDEDGDPVVRFSDGFVIAMDPIDLRRVKTRQEDRMNHGYFGCLENPCPVHHSTSSDQE